MITAVDSNVLIDLLSDEARFAEASAAALQQCQGEGRAVVGDVVLAEIATGLADPTEAEAILRSLGVEFLSGHAATAYAAAAAWRRARTAMGRQRLLPDFLIGGHALTQADRLLTRDTAFYRRWFPELALLEPTAPA